MKRIASLFLAASVNVGCASLTETFDDLNDLMESSTESTPEKPPAVVIAEATDLREQGAWSRAISLVRKAARKFPENSDLQTLLSQLENDWQAEKRFLNNRILVTEVSGLLDTVPLLEKLLNGDSDNQILKSRILFWQSHLERKVDGLTNCGLEEEQEHIQLARRCLRMAYRIDPSPDNQVRLDRVLEKIEAIKQAAIAERDRLEKKRKAQQIRKLLTEAEQERQQGSLNSAMAKLDEALKRDPENPEVRALLAEVQTALNSQANVLIQLGDRLYREEQAGPAIAVWEAALKLDPNQQEITERITRARKVFEKLESIRANEN